MDKVIVIRHRAAGNDTVGTMWHETYEFDSNTSIKEIIAKCTEDGHCEDIIIPARQK